MAGVPIMTVDIVLPHDPALKVRDHTKFLRNAFIHAADYHHRVHMPRHFEDFAAAKYGYLPRSKGYNAVKKRIVGHAHPNVLSGRSRTEILKNRVIRKTANGAMLIMTLPIKGGTGRLLDSAAAARLFAAGKRKNKGFTDKQIEGQKRIIARVKELEAITADEVRANARELIKEYERQANLPTTQKRIRIRTQ